MSFFFFKQKTAYELRISDWSQTCALPISSAARSARRVITPGDSPESVADRTDSLSENGKGSKARSRRGRGVGRPRPKRASVQPQYSLSTASVQDRKSTRLNSSH